MTIFFLNLKINHRNEVITTTTTTTIIKSKYEDVPQKEDSTGRQDLLGARMDNDVAHCHAHRSVLWQLCLRVWGLARMRWRTVQELWIMQVHNAIKKQQTLSCRSARRQFFDVYNYVLDMLSYTRNRMTLLLLLLLLKIFYHAFFDHNGRRFLEVKNLKNHDTKVVFHPNSIWKIRHFCV